MDNDQFIPTTMFCGRCMYVSALTGDEDAVLNPAFTVMDGWALCGECIQGKIDEMLGSMVRRLNEKSADLSSDAEATTVTGDAATEGPPLY